VKRNNQEPCVSEKEGGGVVHATGIFWGSENMEETNYLKAFRGGHITRPGGIPQAKSQEKL